MKTSTIFATVALSIVGIVIGACAPPPAYAPRAPVATGYTFQCGTAVCTSPHEVCLHVRASAIIPMGADGPLSSNNTRPGATAGAAVDIPAHCQPLPEQCRDNPTCSCLGRLGPCREYDGHVTMGEVD